MAFDTTQSPDPAHRILIVGGGMAGSLLALVLGRAGYGVTVVDPRRDPPPMFRNEKLGTEQIELLRDLDALECFEAACWPAGAYNGNPPSLTDCGAPHQAWLKSVRAAWSDNVTFVEGTVTAIDADSATPSITLNSGEVLTGRLVVLASGRMHSLHASLGITHQTLSAGHSACLGFSVTADRFIASQVHHAPFGHDIGYVSIFPMPDEIRVNMFSYRGLNDPWTRRMAQDPLAALADVAPKAAAVLDGARVVRRCEVRGTDLYATEGHRRAGVVLIGDSFHAPCPASGTGMLRILHDIKVLTRHHLPDWMETPGMDVAKINGFYDDAAKLKLDARSLKSSLRGKQWATERGLKWHALRAAKRVKQLVKA